MAARGPQTEGQRFSPTRRLQVQARPTGTSYYAPRPNYDPAAGETFSQIGKAFSELSPSIGRMVEAQNIVFREHATVEADRIAEQMDINEARSVASAEWLKLQKEDPSLRGANPYLIFRVQEGVGARLGKEYSDTLKNNVLKYADHLNTDDSQVEEFMQSQKAAYSGLSFYAQSAFDRSARAADNEFTNQVDQARRSRRIQHERRQTASQLMDALDGADFAQGGHIDMILDGHHGTTGESGRELLWSASSTYIENLVGGAKDADQLELAEAKVYSLLADLSEYSISGAEYGNTHKAELEATANKVADDVIRRKRVIEMGQEDANKKYAADRNEVVAGYAMGTVTLEDAAKQLADLSKANGEEVRPSSDEKTLYDAKAQHSSVESNQRSLGNQEALRAAWVEYLDGGEYSEITADMSPAVRESFNTKVANHRNGMTALAEKSKADNQDGLAAASTALETGAYMSEQERGEVKALLADEMDSITDALEAFIKEQGYDNAVDPAIAAAVDAKAKELFDAAVERVQDTEGKYSRFYGFEDRLLTERDELMRLPGLGKPQDPENPAAFMPIPKGRNEWAVEMAEIMGTPEFQTMYKADRSAGLEHLRSMRQAWIDSSGEPQTPESTRRLAGNAEFTRQRAYSKTILGEALDKSALGRDDSIYNTIVPAMPDMPYLLSDDLLFLKPNESSTDAKLRARGSWSFGDHVEMVGSPIDSAEDFAASIKRVSDHIDAAIVSRLTSGATPPLSLKDGRIVSTSNQKVVWEGAHAMLLTMKARSGFTLEELENSYMVLSNGGRVNIPDRMVMRSDRAFFFGSADDLIESMDAGNAWTRVSAYAYDAEDPEMEERYIKRQLAFAVMNEPSRHADLEAAYLRAYGEPLIPTGKK